jgi:hypothetical protein
MGWVVTPRPPPPAALTSRKGPVTHYTGSCVDPMAFPEGAENLTPIRIKSPKRPARKESLYRLS